MSRRHRNREREPVQLAAAPQAYEAVEDTKDLLRWLLATPKGRELAAWLVIDHCGAFNPMLVTIGNEGATAYGAGKRDIGLGLMELMEAADGDGWDRAVNARRHAKASTAAKNEKARIKKEKELDDG